MNLNKLNYPMFKIDLNEAVILTESLKFLNDYNSCYLCRAVESSCANLGFSFRTMDKLHEKISISLSGNGTISSYLSNISGNRGCGGYRLRRAWVRKLLSHNGY